MVDDSETTGEFDGEPIGRASVSCSEDAVDVGQPRCEGSCEEACASWSRETVEQMLHAAYEQGRVEERKAIFNRVRLIRQMCEGCEETAVREGNSLGQSVHGHAADICDALERDIISRGKI